MDKKAQQSKKQFGTMTATSDANGDYSASTKQSKQQNAGMGMAGVQAGILTSQEDANGDYSSSTMQNQAIGSQSQASKQQASKKKYGTLTAENDANNDY